MSISIIISIKYRGGGVAPHQLRGVRAGLGAAGARREAPGVYSTMYICMYIYIYIYMYLFIISIIISSSSSSSNSLIISSISIIISSSSSIIIILLLVLLSYDVYISPRSAWQSGISRIGFSHSYLSVPRMCFCVVFSCLAILRIEGCLSSTLQQCL